MLPGILQSCAGLVTTPIKPFLQHRRHRKFFFLQIKPIMKFLTRELRYSSSKMHYLLLFTPQSLQNFSERQELALVSKIYNPVATALVHFSAGEFLNQKIPYSRLPILPFETDQKPSSTDQYAPGLLQRWQPEGSQVLDARAGKRSIPFSPWEDFLDGDDVFRGHDEAASQWIFLFLAIEESRSALDEALQPFGSDVFIRGSKLERLVWLEKNFEGMRSMRVRDPPTALAQSSFQWYCPDGQPLVRVREHVNHSVFQHKVPSFPSIGRGVGMERTIHVRSEHEVAFFFGPARRSWRRHVLVFYVDETVVLHFFILRRKLCFENCIGKFDFSIFRTFFKFYFKI